MTDKKTKTHTVHFATTEDGQHICASLETPLFCFIGKSEEELAAKAERALNFYFETNGRLKTQPKPVSKANTVVGFVPQTKREIEYA